MNRIVGGQLHTVASAAFEVLLPEAIAEISPAARRGLQRGLQQIIVALDLKDEAAGTTPLAEHSAR
jgi:hypothetical protein